MNRMTAEDLEGLEELESWVSVHPFRHYLIIRKTNTLGEAQWEIEITRMSPFWQASSRRRTLHEAVMDVLLKSVEAGLS